MKQCVIMSLAVASSFCGMANLTHVQAKDFQTPEVLMLGDSQLSFGTGQEMIHFFDDFENRCSAHVSNKDVLSKITHMRKTLIGARSTTLRSWSTEEGGAYDKICEKDPNWGVNASIWGHMRDKTRKYIQIGESEHFNFCKNSTPPMTAMFEEGYDPKLLLINVLGNAASKWSGSPKGAELDLKGFLKLIPDDLPCVYIATMPTYTKKRNDRRFKAQNNLKKAMDKLGNRCTFVKTLDADTIGAIQSHPKYFRRRDNGKVKDPFHPQRNAAELVLKMKERHICQAVVEAVLPHWKGKVFEVAALKEAEDNVVEQVEVKTEAKVVEQVEVKARVKTEAKGEVMAVIDNASVLKEVKPKTNVLEEVKVVELVPQTAVGKVKQGARPKTVKPIARAAFLRVKTLPQGETIESHKMSIQVQVNAQTSLEENSDDEFAVLGKKPLNATLEMPKTLIRGSVDLHFTNGETSSKVVHIKSQSN